MGAAVVECNLQLLYFTMRSFVLAFFFFFISLEASAKKIAYFWGGGGEPHARSTTIFDRDLEAIGPALQAAGYELNLAFAVGHKASEKLAERFVGRGHNKPFTVATVRSELEILKNRIEDREITEGDQILFIISSHGDNPDVHPDVSTHMIRVTNFSKNEGIGLDRLFSVRDLAEKNNIKFALMDMSCYGGASLALASAKTCVIASSSAQELAYTGHAAKMSQFLTSGADLESVFLKSRGLISEFASPEISTFANSVAKVRTLVNSTASSPIKPGTSVAAFSRHSQFLQEVHGKSYGDLKKILSLIPQYAELESMKKARDTYQDFALKKDSISFEELDQAKGSASIRYYFNERSLYKKIYEQFQDVPGPNPCRDFKF